MDGIFLIVAFIVAAVLSLLFATRAARSRRTCPRERSNHSAIGGRGWIGGRDDGGWFGGGDGGGWGGGGWGGGDGGGGGCGGGDGGGC